MTKVRFLGLLFLVMISTLCFDVSFAEGYHYGARVSETIPDWIIPSTSLNNGVQKTTLDEFVDNSAGLPPVGSQGQQNSCVAWALAYYCMTYLQGQEYGWDLSDPAHQMSPAFAYNLTNGGYNTSAEPFEVIRLFQEMGCATMEDMPFISANCTNFPSEAAFRNGQKFRTLSGVAINTSEMAGINELRAHLADGNIAATVVTVYPHLHSINSHDTTYCVNDIAGDAGNMHAVTIVGYDDSRETVDGTGAFKMVNSWGTGWGNRGFFWMSYEAFIDARIGYGLSAYLIDRIEYEPKLIARLEVDHSDRYALNYYLGRGSSDNPSEGYQFFDYPFGADNNIAYNNTIVLDITDYYDSIDSANPNQFFVKIDDRDADDGQSGNVQNFQIIDLVDEFTTTCLTTPSEISDTSPAFSSNIVLYYMAVPPENVTAELDVETGQVMLDWDPVATNDLYNGYGIYRNGVRIDSTTASEFADVLPEYGLYNYKIKSLWDDCNSEDSESVSINWIVPVQSSFTGLMSIDGESGDYLLAWEQLREQEILFDDGLSDSPYIFSSSASEGAKIAQKITISDAGKMLSIGAYFVSSDNIEMDEIKFALFSGDGAGTPANLLWESEALIPEAEAWTYYNFNSDKLPLNVDDEVWMAVSWMNPETSPLGQDTDGLYRNDVVIMPDAANWVPMSNGSIPMIRARYGADESVNGNTGLVGFDIFQDGDLLSRINTDDHVFNGNLTETGDHTFRVDAVYLQETVTGEELNYNWDGSSAFVEETDVPLTWNISPAYPNPFNPSTLIAVELSKSSNINIRVFNLLGQQVAELVNGKVQQGTHKFRFDGNGLSSGVYLIRTDVRGYGSKTMKVTFIQ